MKKNRTMRVAVLMLALSLITCCFVGSTFAKYTSSATGSDTVKVAKWSFAVSDNDEIAVAGNNAEIEFNLFDTVSLDEANDDVAAGLIAPGTKGSFEFDIVNNSEVTAEYTIALTETNASNVPLQYSVDGSTWKDSIAELVMDDLTDVRIAMSDGAAGGADEATVTVYWRWVFNDTDTAVNDGSAHANQTNTTDTALGIGAQTTPAEVTIGVTVTVEQVD